MMKNFLTITVSFIAAITLFSCNDDVLEPGEPEITIFFQADPNALTFGNSDKDAQSVYVTALNTAWKAEVESSAQEWLEITREPDRIDVRVRENTTEKSRTGNIIVTPDNESLNPIEITVWQSLQETVHIPVRLGVLEFEGDKYGCGFSNYLLKLGSGETAYDPEENKFSVTDGYYVVLDLLAEDISYPDYQVIDLKPGTYRASMNPKDEQFEYETMCFIVTSRGMVYGKDSYNGSRIALFADGKVVENIELKSGSIVVEKENGEYAVSAEFSTRDGRKVVMNYSGPFDDKKSAVSVSTFTDDFILENFASGSFINLGEVKEAPGCNRWGLSLLSSEEKCTGQVVLYLYSPQTDPDAPDDGEYSLTGKSPYTEFTAQAGTLQANAITRGCWTFAYSTTGRQIYYSPLIEGTIKVKGNGENNYTITIDAFMDNYYKLEATLEGDLKYVDE